MPSRIENLFRVRDLLDSPQVAAPNFHRMFEQEISEEMDIVNATLETGRPWATATWTLNYNCNQTQYPINVSNFGKVLYVVKATGNCLLPYINVPFSDMETQQLGTVWPMFDTGCGQAFLPWTDTPEQMCFYREGVLNPQPMLEINPRPQQNAQYVITYLPGYIGTADPLTANVQMPEHVELLRLRTAMALLPYAKWGEDEVENRIKRKELSQAFAYQLERKERQFYRYISSIAVPKQVFVDSWNGY